MNASDLCGKIFIASYSGGKDSVLAMHRAINSGLLPLGLLTTYNLDSSRSWSHGMNENLMQQASDSLKIPLTIIKTPGNQYEENFESVLTEMKNRGAEVCVFGDIDIKGHFEWYSERCKKAGLIPFFPLWKEEREKVVYEFIDAGFFAIITAVDTNLMSKEFLGQLLTREVADSIDRSGADICGENGEYHTFVFDGPIFSKKVDFIVKDEIRCDKYILLNLETNPEITVT